MSGYRCKECGATVYLETEGLRRTCEHRTTVLANMSATAYGEGGASERSGVSAVFAKLHALGLKYLGARV